MRRRALPALRALTAALLPIALATCAPDTPHAPRGVLVVSQEQQAS